MHFDLALRAAALSLRAFPGGRPAALVLQTEVSPREPPSDSAAQSSSSAPAVRIAAALEAARIVDALSEASRHAIQGATATSNPLRRLSTGREIATAAGAFGSCAGQLPANAGVGGEHAVWAHPSVADLEADSFEHRLDQPRIGRMLFANVFGKLVGRPAHRRIGRGRSQPGVDRRCVSAGSKE